MNYSYDDRTQLSTHFNVQEFKCKCGENHDILIENDLIDKLEMLFDKLDCSKIIVNSGYRCSTRDKNVGGNGIGQHTKGTAADIVCYNQNGEIISSKFVSCAAQDIGFMGIANIDDSYTATHVDVRTNGYWFGDEIYGTGNITDDFYDYFNMSYVMKGIDVSKHQGNIDWSKVHVDFAIIRAGYGDKKDDTMDGFVKDCKANGIDFGFYWYSYAMSVKQAEAEAEKCVAVLKGLSPTYPVFFDMEEKKQISGLNTDTRTKMAIAFCEKIRQAGFKPGIYANPAFMENYYDKQQLVGKYDIWLAHWTNSPDHPSRYNYGQTMWQWGLDRIGGYDIDGDICFFDYAKSAPTKETVEQLADEVIAGKWDNGAERERLLTAAGYDYNAVQKRVNEKLYKKTVDEIANEVIRGEWGNGEERKERLTAAGYDYYTVQARVNELLK